MLPIFGITIDQENTNFQQTSPNKLDPETNVLLDTFKTDIIYKLSLRVKQMSSAELNNFTEEQMIEDLKKYILNKLPSLPEESVNNTSKLIASEISDLVDNTIINYQRETRAKIGMSKVKTLLLTPLKYLVGSADIDTGEESDKLLEGSETITTYDNRPI